MNTITLLFNLTLLQGAVSEPYVREGTNWFS